MTFSVVLVIFAAFALATIATGLMRVYALQRHLVDVPNLRSSHASPTPRGGGVGIAIGFLVSEILLAVLGLMDARMLRALMLGGGAMALVGFLDDRWRLGASVRFCVHLSAAIWAVVQLGGIPESALANWGLHGVGIGGLVAVVIIIWTTNLFNFMDGIDGLAGSEAAFVTGAGACINWLQGGSPGLTAAMLCLAGASLGFLRWNWPPARIFMGDVGSGFIGFSLAVLGLAASTMSVFPIEAWAILGGVFLVDATVTLVRRVARGDRWFEAHRIHAYQHLARRYKAHLPVTVLAIVINIVWLLPWAMVAVKFPTRAPLFLALALVPLAIFALACGAGAKERQT
jgi:Fuc2NAc and GlcNAc transferase